jgi:hypothetical protein
MDGKRIPKRILESNIIGKRLLGKPRKRWVNAVKTDSREILKVRNWEIESLNTQVWRRHLKEPKDRLRAVATYKKKKKTKTKTKTTKKQKKKKKNRSIK